MALQHLRSSTANKRPTPGAMSDGQLALNTNLVSPGLFFKDSNGDTVKIGPVHVGTTAPNVSPAVGGEAGNSLGEAWLDTTAANPILKVWNGSAFVAVQPVGTGTVVSTTDTGTVTSTMILDGTILNADVNASAAIAGTKISPDFGSQTIASTGVFSHPLGAAATPSLTFTGDLNTGIYSPGADQVAISTNGTQRLLIDSSGNISLGSLGAAAGVTNLRGSSYHQFAVANDLYVDTTPLGGQIIFRRNAGASESVRIDGSGRLGIGTSSPSTRLHLNSADASANYLRVENTGGYALFGVDASGNTYAGAESNDAFGLVTNGSYRMYITAGGNVGIGTASPGNTLHLSGTNGVGIRIENTSNSISAYSTLESSGGLQANISGSGFFSWVTGGGEKVRIDSSGRLLVGTSSTSSVSLLLVQGNSSSSTGGAVVSLQRGATSPTSGSLLGEIRFGDSSSNNGAYITGEADGAWTSGSSQPTRLTFFTAAAGSSSPTERMRISQNGQFSVFKDSGSSHFTFRCADTASSSAAFVLTQGATNNTNGTNAFIIAFNGNATNTNNSYGAISDIKLKENIVDANSQWDDLKALQVRKYNFKEGQTHTQIGLVAQEVELVSPGLVSESPDRDEDGNDLGTVTKSVNYSVLYMKAVKALQEAMERIETLEARLTAAGIE
jgi:hypothetical protein